jgi:tetratricopeptide (TPR) repeat protein
MNRTLCGVVLAISLVGCGPKKEPETPVSGPASAGQQGTTTPGDPSVGTAAGQLPATPAKPKAPLEERVAAATALLTTGSPEDAGKAVSKLKLLVQESASSAELHYNLGLAYELIEDTTSARKEYLRATDLDPTVGHAWLNMGAMAEREGDFDRALQSYRAGLRHAPEHPQLVSATIGVLRRLNRHEDAIRQAKKAIQTNANNVDAYNNLGLVYLDLGKLELAQFMYQRALQAIPNADKNAMVHANLGRIYLAQGRRPLAEVKFKDALLQDENLVAAMIALGGLYTENRNWEGTVVTLERARELEPDNAAVRVNLGIGYRGQGRFEDALASYQKALELDPELVDVYLNLALLYGDSMQAFDKAFGSLDRYTDLGGTETELAETWRAEFTATKTKIERDKARLKRREDQRKKREEDARLLEVKKQNDDKAAAEEAEKEAARAAEEAKRQAEEAAAPAPAPAPAPTEGAGGDPAGAPAPAPAAGNLGQACKGLGSCADSALECANDDVCREVGTPGTFGAGVGCVESSDCASGLGCVENACIDAGSGNDSGTGTPWGGQ